MNTATLAQSESIVGTAVPADTFILIETPQPWEKPALLSPGVSEALRQVIKPWLSFGIRVHLIANEHTLNQRRRRMLIFQQSGNSHQDRNRRLVGDYKAWEIQMDSAAAMASALDQFLKNNRADWQPIPSGQRHLMVCTHASHNECCGMYGYPFYRGAIAAIQTLGLTEQVHPWQISHIGGHRFAPTLIDFPQGRYYGNLDQASLPCLLKHQGDIEPLLSSYRGWSLLSKPLQILEAELLRQYQWDWLEGEAKGHILKQNQEHTWVELWFRSPKHSLRRYTAELRNNQLLSYQLDPEQRIDFAPLMHRKTG